MASQDEILAEARKRAQECGLPVRRGLRVPRKRINCFKTRQGRADRRAFARGMGLRRAGAGRGGDRMEDHPGMRPNEGFLEQLQSRVPKDALALFMCRSGARSHETAAVAKRAGYENAFNVVEGFEGDRDPRDTATVSAAGGPQGCRGRRAEQAEQRFTPAQAGSRRNAIPDALRA